VIRIAFAGPPSVGKTMLARELSVILKKISCWADMVNEAHRPYLVRNVWPQDRDITAEDEYEMFCRQMENEQDFAQVQSDYVFHEMPLFQDLIWFQYKKLDETAQGKPYFDLMEKECNRDTHKCDLIFLCNPKNVPNVRQRVSNNDREVLYKHIKQYVADKKPYITNVYELNEGDFDKKVSRVLEKMAFHYPEVSSKLAAYRTKHGKVMEII